MNNYSFHLREPWNIRGTVGICRSRTTGNLFGIRFRIERQRLVADYAFPIGKDRTQRDDFDDNVVIHGDLETDTEYPGCPDNDDRSFFKCGCGHLTSWTESLENTAECRWCGYNGPCKSGAHGLSGAGDY